MFLRISWNFVRFIKCRSIKCYSNKKPSDIFSIWHFSSSLNSPYRKIRWINLLHRINYNNWKRNFGTFRDFWFLSIWSAHKKCNKIILLWWWGRVWCWRAMLIKTGQKCSYYKFGNLFAWNRNWQLLIYNNVNFWKWNNWNFSKQRWANQYTKEE